MPDIQKAAEGLQTGADVFFLLMGAILVFAMHGGFAFLEVGTVRHKNQVNALCKILVDFAISTVAYFFIGYTIAYGVTFFSTPRRSAAAAKASIRKGLTLVKFFFLCTFAAAVPAIVSGGIAERAKFCPQCVATGADRRPVLSASSKASSGTRTSACRRASSKHARRRVPRLRRLDRRARHRRLDRLLRRTPARAPARPLRQGAASASRRRRSRGWPWAPGCCASAGSASTS